MIIDTAREFLTRCFYPGETIAILLRRETPAAVMQRIVRLEQAIAPRYLRWLAHQNAVGMNVYAAANPLRSGSRKRTKESIAIVRHLYLDIDASGDSRLAALLGSSSVPPPNAVVTTSPGKYQVLWRVEGFDFAAQEQTLKSLALAFGGDPACTDCNRVIRIPGFRNCKYVPPVLVSVEYGSSAISRPDDFSPAIGSSDTIAGGYGRSRTNHANKQTRSEQDWAWVFSELAKGREAVELTEALASRRADKPNPRYYAQRTVDLATARIALLTGTNIADVITGLEDRRCAELPAAIRSARAREIAHTAARMVALHHTA